MDCITATFEWQPDSLPCGTIKEDKNETEWICWRQVRLQDSLHCKTAVSQTLAVPLWCWPVAPESAFHKAFRVDRMPRIVNFPNLGLMSFVLMICTISSGPCGVEECSIRALRLSPVRQGSCLANASGGLATLDDGSIPYAPSAFARTKGCHKTASGNEAVRPPKTTQQ